VKRWLGHQEVEDFLVATGEATPIQGKTETEMAISEEKNEPMNRGETT
jgi:hypothetical protein